MSRLILVGLAVAAVTGGAYYYANFKTEIRRGQDGKLQGLSITPRTGQTDAAPLGRSAILVGAASGRKAGWVGPWTRRRPGSGAR